MAELVVDKDAVENALTNHSAALEDLRSNLNQWGRYIKSLDGKSPTPDEIKFYTDLEKKLEKVKEVLATAIESSKRIIKSAGNAVNTWIAAEEQDRNQKTV